MVLYHGSPEIVEKPIFGFGSDKNDYGRGFYCTEKIELAKEWACPTIKIIFSLSGFLLIVLIEKERGGKTTACRESIQYI